MTISVRSEDPVSEIRNIAVIGATGKLAIPVVQELKNTYKVRAIVRNLEKAKKIFPNEIDIHFGDIRDEDSLSQALTGQDAIYINLSTETTNPSLPFYEEREGVKNIVEAAKKKHVKYISKIGALGAYPLATHLKGKNVLPNIIRSQGHKFIEDSGIPYTIFDPSFFMDTLLWVSNGKAVQWIGNARKQQLRWISSNDYAKEVVAALQRPQFWNKHYPVQGPEAIDPFTAMKRFIAAYDPKLRIRIAPLWLIQAIGLFSPRMRFLGHMFSYFEKQDDPFYAEVTWKELGKPTTTIEEFARAQRGRVSLGDAK